jgi:hypothetical protein
MDPTILVAPVPGDIEPVEPIVVGEGCLGEDPCTISSRPMLGCLPPDCSVSSDGAIDCPGYPICDLPVPVDPAVEAREREPEVKPLPVEQPCSTEPCIGGEPAVGAPEGIVEECVSPPSDGAPESSGGGSSGTDGSGPVETLPAPAE